MQEHIKEWSEDRAYYVFVLGYDLLQDYFKGEENNECDNIFKVACKIYADFEKSEEYSYNCSGYEALVHFLNRINVYEYFEE